MIYRTFDSEGKQLSTGVFNDCLPTVPTHGSISFKIDNKWLNIRTSEWMVGELSNNIKTWGGEKLVEHLDAGL